MDNNIHKLGCGVRCNHSELKARYIAACIEEIKNELRQESPFIKANAIEKLAYVSVRTRPHRSGFSCKCWATTSAGPRSTSSR